MSRPTRLDIRKLVCSAILRVLAANGTQMSSSLHALVNADIVRQDMYSRGCTFWRMRYALRWLVDNDMVTTKQIPDRPGIHFFYTIATGALLRDVLEPIVRETPVQIPLCKSTPMEFSRNALSLVASTFDYAAEYPDAGVLV